MRSAPPRRALSIAGRWPSLPVWRQYHSANLTQRGNGTADGGQCRSGLNPSRREEDLDLVNQTRLAEPAEQATCCAVIVDEDPRRLRRDLIAAPDVAALISHMAKGADPGVGDEGLHRADAVSSGDADDLDLTVKLFSHRCDRRGFCTATASPGRPEPQDDVLPGEIVGVELASAELISDERVGPVGRDAFVASEPGTGLGARAPAPSCERSGGGDDAEQATKGVAHSAHRRRRCSPTVVRAGQLQQEVDHS